MMINLNISSHVFLIIKTMKNTIVNELSNSLKSGDKKEFILLDLFLAAIKDKEIASRSNGENDEISSDVVSGLLKKMIKQRNDAIEMFEKANRQELVQKRTGRSQNYKRVFARST